MSPIDQDGPVPVSCAPDERAPQVDTAFVRWQQWRAERDRSLQEPYGWLSPVALHWLDDTPRRFPETPGTWSATAGAVTLSATAADGLTRDGEPVVGESRIVDASRPWTVADRRIELMRHNIGWAVRVRDPQSPTRLGFTGVPTYDFDPAWQLDGTFVPFDAPRDTTVLAVVAGLAHPATALGTVRCVVASHPVELLAFAGGPNLVVLFTDATSGVSTNAGSRALVIPAPVGSTDVVVDFNRATNPPAAFTAFATCPLAPPENRLPFAVTAGERRPR
ncbi:DUF1684 domain-containing protein [Dactylosporangium sp. NPDC051485]|uniref:DUF1684 domain-containing protein n=1 Tax=Dactylosporangium sp. NPDC051485 TaxID=3154846 RepID=UPI003413BC21